MSVNTVEVNTVPSTYVHLEKTISSSVLTYGKTAVVSYAFKVTSFGSFTSSPTAPPIWWGIYFKDTVGHNIARCVLKIAADTRLVTMELYDYEYASSTSSSLVIRTNETWYVNIHRSESASSYNISGYMTKDPSMIDAATGVEGTDYLYVTLSDIHAPTYRTSKLYIEFYIYGASYNWENYYFLFALTDILYKWDQTYTFPGLTALYNGLSTTWPLPTGVSSTEYAMTLKDFLLQELNQYLSSMNATKDRSGSTSDFHGGTPSVTYPSLGTFGESIETAFSNLADSIDAILTFPFFDYSLPKPFNGIADLVNDGLNGISDALENVSDGMLNGLTSTINTVPKLVDDLIEQIKLQINRLPNFVHSLIDVSISETWDLTPLVNELFSNADVLSLIPEGFTEPLLGLGVPDGTFTFPANSITIPKKIKISLGSYDYYLSLFDIPLAWIPFYLRNQMVPTSDTWKGRRSIDSRRPTFISDSTDVGVPVIDFIGALVTYGTGGASLAGIAYYAPKIAYLLIQKIFSFTSSQYHATNDDLAVAMHPKDSYNNKWELGANETLEELAGNIQVTSNDNNNQLKNVSTNLKKSYKRIYTLNKIISKYKMDLGSLEDWLSSIDIDLIDIDAITSALDDLITTNIGEIVTDGSQIANLQTSNNELAGALNEVDDQIHMLQDVVGLRMT